MIFLLLSILSSTTIAVIFKLMAGKSIELLPVIVINYFAALIAGLLLFDGELSVQYILQSTWIYISIFIDYWFLFDWIHHSKSGNSYHYYCQ